MKVKITKESTDGESESDVEIDIENDEEEGKSRPDFVDKIALLPLRTETSECVSETKVPEEFFNISECDDTTISELKSLEEPNCELVMDPANISELEKVVHSDFFEGRPAKTPSRYLKVFVLVKKNRFLNCIMFLDSQSHYKYLVVN